LTLLPKNIFSYFWEFGKKYLRIELSPFQRGVIEAYKGKLPVNRIARESFCSVSTVNRVVQKASGLGFEVNIRPPGRPPVNREIILERFDRALDRGDSPSKAVKYAAFVVGCSEATVYRARREK